LVNLEIIKIQKNVQIVSLKKNVLENIMRRIKMGNVKAFWMFAGIILFGCGIGFKDIYMFIGGMFLMVITLISTFPDD